MAVSSVSRPAFQARSRIAAASDRLTCPVSFAIRSEEHTSELQSQSKLVCRLLLEKKKLAEARLVPGLAVDAGVGGDDLHAPQALDELALLRHLGGVLPHPPAEREIHGALARRHAD